MTRQERYVSFDEAAHLTGIDRYRIGLVVRRAHVPVFRSHLDRRKKLVREGDLWLLTAPRRSGEPQSV